MKKPYIICHMMSTIEGKITSGVDGVDILDEYFDMYTQIEHEHQAQAWMCGRVTSQMFASGMNTPLPDTTKEISYNDFIAPFSSKMFFIAIDTKGVLRWSKNTVTLENQPNEDHIVVIVTKRTPKAYLAYLQEKQISYLLCGEDEIDFPLVFQKLKAVFSIEKLLLEGGGILNGSVMSAGLIDEISLLLLPIVLNKSNAPTMFEQTTDVIDVKKYALSEVKKMEKDTVWLRYRKRS